MTALQRIDELDAPPVVGRDYLVPTVRGTWDGRVWDWPVIGPAHHDRHDLNFPHWHYHLDARVMPFSRADFQLWRRVAAVPLMINENGVREGALPEPVWKRRKCRRVENPFADQIEQQARRTTHFHGFFCKFEGRQARRDEQGWICPHRAVPLGSMPVRDGVVRCPLHFLKIDAATGRVVRAAADATEPELSHETGAGA